jgi:hypothetical protein
MPKRRRPPSLVSKPPEKARKRNKAAGIVHTSVYLPQPMHDALREAAFKERSKIHDIVLEGIELALRKRKWWYWPNCVTKFVCDFRNRSRAMATKKPLNAVDELKLGASSLSLAIAQTIYETDKTFPKRLIPRVENILRDAESARMTHVVELLHLFLNALRKPQNFPPWNI